MAEGRFNGRTGEYMRWAGGLILAGLVAYLTTVGTMQTEIEKVRTTEDAHFNEILRTLQEMKVDIRELRNRP